MQYDVWNFRFSLQKWRVEWNWMSVWRGAVAVPDNNKGRSSVMPFDTRGDPARAVVPRTRMDRFNDAFELIEIHYANPSSGKPSPHPGHPSRYCSPSARRVKMSRAPRRRTRARTASRGILGAFVLNNGICGSETSPPRHHSPTH